MLIIRLADGRPSMRPHYGVSLCHTYSRLEHVRYQYVPLIYAVVKLTSFCSSWIGNLYSSKQFQVEFKISKFRGKVRQHVSQMSDRWRHVTIAWRYQSTAGSHRSDLANMQVGAQCVTSCLSVWRLMTVLIWEGRSRRPRGLGQSAFDIRAYHYSSVGGPLRSYTHPPPPHVCTHPTPSSSHFGGTAAAVQPPFRPSEPALCGSCPLVTPYYCRLGDLLCLFV